LRRNLITRIVIASMLGAVTTVVIAWAAALIDISTVTDWVYENREIDGIVANYATRHSRLRSDAAWDTVAAQVSSTEQARDTIWEVALGWPMAAMKSVARIPARRSVGDTSVLALSGIPLAPLIFDDGAGRLITVLPRVLPLRVLPLGFAVNTAIAAALWWLLLFAFPTSRRFLRHRRGACLRCGYGPLASPDARCSECGSIRGERLSST